jgi:membrane protein implicated in regulation of membrane protease activity
MSADNMKGLIRGAAISMPVGLALLIGGAAAIAGSATTLGAALIAGAIVSVGTGLVLMLQVRSRARAFSRDMQARQQANLDATIRDYRNSQS